MTLTLGDGKVLNLQVIEHTLCFEVHSLQCDKARPADDEARPSNDSFSNDAENIIRDPSKRKHDKRDALKGLVAVILYLESLTKEPKSQVDSLWRLYERIDKDNIQGDDVGTYQVDDEAETSSSHEVLPEPVPVPVAILEPLELEPIPEEVPSVATEMFYETVTLEQDEEATIEELVNETVPLEPGVETTIVQPVNGYNPDTDITQDIHVTEGDNQDERANLPSLSKAQGKNKFTCDDCGKRFFKRLTYAAHLRTHAGLVPFVCKECNRVYQTLIGYRAHMVTHKNIEFQCELCGKAFNTRGNLYTHMRSHDVVKRHECKICGKRSSTSSGNLSHMKIHTGDKPHSCSMCGSSFSRMANYKKHMLVCETKYKINN